MQERKIEQYEEHEHRFSNKGEYDDINMTDAIAYNTPAN